MSDISLKALFEAGAHYGHRVRFWHPSNSRFVYGRHAGIHIINLDRTIEAFRRALEYLTAQVADGKTVLFVCTKRIAQPHLAQAAQRCRMPYVDNRWLGGTLTNFYTVRQSIDRLDSVEKMLDDEKLSTVYVKKEILRMRKNYQKLLRSFGGIRQMDNLPDILFVIDVGYERIAVSEAKKLGIPVVGIVDTNHSSENIDFPIPANDDSMSAIRIYLDTVAAALCQILPEGAPEEATPPATLPATPPATLPATPPATLPVSSVRDRQISTAVVNRSPGAGASSAAGATASGPGESGEIQTGSGQAASSGVQARATQTTTAAATTGQAASSGAQAQEVPGGQDDATETGASAGERAEADDPASQPGGSSPA